MGHYNTFKDGYAFQPDFTTTGIANNAATAYQIGALASRCLHPVPRWDIIYNPVEVGNREVSAGEAFKANPIYNGMWVFVVQNGISLYMAMGASSTAGAGPYTHTITPDVLPAITIQHERTGTATAQAIQFKGCMCAGHKLLWDAKKPYLIAVMDWVAYDATDPGFTLTNSPALPATATTGPYNSLSTATYGGANLPPIENIEFVVNPRLQPVMVRQFSGGTDLSVFPLGYAENLRREYSLKITLAPDSDDLWDESISRTNTSDIVLKWQKSANDYIQLTLSDCHVLFPDTATPDPEDILLETYEFAPERVSIEVKDTIAGGLYNE